MSKPFERVGLMLFISGVTAVFSPLTVDYTTAFVVMVCGIFVYTFFGDWK